MKSALSLGKTTSSALIFATIGCLVSSISAAQATPGIVSSTVATSADASSQNQASTDFSSATELADTIPTTPLALTELPKTEATDSDRTEANAIALSTAPTEFSALPEISNLETGVEPTTQTNSEDLLSPTPLQAQTLPTNEVDESLAPNAMPFEPAYGDESDPMGQVTNVSQLQDVRPNDWAYEALRELVERYGCIAGYPDGSFRGNRALTRYEFAAGLNSCLNQVERLIAGVGSDLVTQQDLETLRRLQSEFEVELATLGTRVDNLEGRLATLEDNQFSTTTKLFGQAIVGVQGRSEGNFELFNNPIPDTDTNVNVINNVQLSLFTQFSPRSILLTSLQAGAGRTSNFPGTLGNYVGLGYEGDNNNDLQLTDLNYRQLFGNKFAVIVGPEGVNPVNVFRGVNRIESAGTGPLSRFAQRNPIINTGGGRGGIGFDWQLASRFSLQGVYSAGSPADAANGGLFGGDNGTTTIGTQLVASPIDTLDVSLQYINSYSPFGRLGTGVGDDFLSVPSFSARTPISTNAIGAGLEWRVSPRVTAGGWAGYTTSDFKNVSGNVETFNWMAFLNFPDLLGEGNLLGLYVGQPPKITSSDLPVGQNIPSFLTLGNPLAGEGGQPSTTTHVEAFYRFRVSNNINITPGVIVIFNPLHNSDNETITIGALRTTFSF
ncbi:MAG: iron uptake porin [Kastovskya adunca ATA6-11-RM4]|nr:iron uptake porin [Kastovskya adunca ATA6-11-RM4]